jgi:hypothetical protein
MSVAQGTVRRRGVTTTVDTVTVANRVFVVTGRLLRTAEPKRYYEEDLHDPAEAIGGLKEAPLRIDVLKFRQRVPDTTVRYGYFHELREAAVIPISTQQHWFEKQIGPSTRKHIRRAERAGVCFREQSLSEQLIRDIMTIYNDSPVRRGKRFWHYGKDFDTVSRELSDDREKSVFLTAYYGNELVGFIKLLLDDRFARTTLLMDKLSRRVELPSPMYGLFSKAVEICAERHIPHIVYSVWRRGEHGSFQQRNGFVKMPVPEYFVPLTLRGRLALLLGLHNGIKARIPERMMINLLNLRARWYTLRFRT